MCARRVPVTHGGSPPKASWAKSKLHNTTVLLLAAVSRPRKLSNGVWFDGKIGIWPIVSTNITQHSSKH
ncbi:unnamed protein product [Choristocarpus tenellus]